MVVSVHDVAPPTLTSVRAILADLDAWGVARRTLLVVPRYHGRWSVESSPDFRHFLLSRDPDRDEICLHGYEHLAQPRPLHGLARLIATRYTDREGEFYRLDTESALRLVRKGRESLAHLGIAPPGFVAPAWLHSRELDRELQSEGLLYTTRLWSITMLQPRVHSVPAPTLVYSARRRWRLLASLGWNPCLWRLVRLFRCVRLGIHPRDWDVAAFRRQIHSILRSAARTRTFMTYAEIAETLRRESEP